MQSFLNTIRTCSTYTSVYAYFHKYHRHYDNCATESNCKRACEVSKGTSIYEVVAKFVVSSDS